MRCCMFFSKKAKQINENAAFLRKLHGREVKYVSRRNNEDYSEDVIGREGTINVVDDDIVIVCGNDIVLRQPIKKLEAGEFLSHDGVNFKYFDEDKGKQVNIVAYYKYYRDV